MGTEITVVTVGTKATVGIHCCNNGNWSNCWNTLQQLKPRLLLAHNNDLGYQCCLWHHCCICYAFWGRVIFVHSSFEPCLSTSNLMSPVPLHPHHYNVNSYFTPSSNLLQMAQCTNTCYITCNTDHFNTYSRSSLLQKITVFRKNVIITILI
jgi:hypothetical protein